jgi:polyhydroxybutyrate depolymerase
MTRNYLLYTPTNLGGAPVPLVLLFHGHSGNAAQMSGASGRAAPFKVWQHIADEEPMVLAYLDGEKGSDHQQGWNDCRADTKTNPATDDVAFVSQLIDDLANRFPIDRKRIYASGISNGGHMSFRLAVEMPDRIAAVAAVSASFPVHSGCKTPQTPISVLVMDGTDDPLSPYNGGEVMHARGLVMSAHETADFWAQVDGITAAPVNVELPDVDPSDGTTVQRETRTGTSGIQVVLYTIQGGGHVDPSQQEKYRKFVTLALGKQSHDIEMAREVWAFFKDKHLP